MADDKDLSPEDKAKKDREEAVKAQDNPPQPYPSPEQLEKADGGPLDTDNDDDDDDEKKLARAAVKTQKAEEAEKARQAKAAEAKPAPGTYQTR